MNTSFVRHVNPASGSNNSFDIAGNPMPIKSVSQRDAQGKRIQKKNRKAGFTLIELLVVIFIIAILAGIAVPVFQRVVYGKHGERKTVIVHRENGATEYQVTSVALWDDGMVRFITTDGTKYVTPVVQTEIVTRPNVER